MMFGVSRVVALLLAFVVGFATCAFAFVGAFGMAASTLTIGDLKDYDVPIPGEEYLGDNPEVDLLDLTLVDFCMEWVTLKNDNERITFRVLQKRYDIILYGELDKILTDTARDMPLSELFTEEGFAEVLSSVYLGHIEGYECHGINDNLPADPSDKENTRWYNPSKGEYIGGIDETIAYFTFYDFVRGHIETDAVLQDIILADVLGYTLDEETGKWYDSTGKQVTGVMAIFADCTIDGVSSKINTVKLGEFFSYEEQEDGSWLEKDEETGDMKPVSQFMNKIANSTLDNVNSVFDTLVIGDIVDAESMERGIFSIIPADTNINNIGDAVNNSVENSPLQFFINEGIISFEETQILTLDQTCKLKGQLTTLNKSDEDANHFKNTSFWDEADSKGNFKVPTWRIKPLHQSFSFVIELLTGEVVDPDFDIDA